MAAFSYPSAKALADVTACEMAIDHSDSSDGEDTQAVGR